MFNCTKKQLPADASFKCAPPIKVVNKKPIVLSSQRYAKVLSHANNTEVVRAQKEAEEDKKYREYLKNGSDELVALFKGNIQRTQENKLEELKQKMEHKHKQGYANYVQSKENEEKIRREKIAKAQQLIDKLKPGPRELHSAAIQSEVLRVRNVQRNINAEFEKTIKEQEEADKLICATQNPAWIKEEQERIAEHRNRTNNYKKEIMQTISENSKMRSEQKKQLIKEQQAAREALDMEIKAQIEKEKAIMEKKRAALRKNALEAMKMVEQRRLRERMTDELEDRLCCVYNAGKHQLDKLKLEKTKQVAAERAKAIDANSSKFLVGMGQSIQAIEAERLRRDISCMQLKFTNEEQEKIRKDKAAKQARIEAYMREMQQQKEAKQRASEEKRYEMALRFKNTEVNCLFTEAEKQERLRKVQEVREQLNDQNAVSKIAEIAEKEDVRKCEKEAYRQTTEKEDKFFFEYARNLMEDAQKKDRPLHPFAKVVQQYKRNNQIDCERKTPKHLVSHLNMGLRQPGDSKATNGKPTVTIAASTQKSTDKPKAEKTDKEIILENCLKITEMLDASRGVGNVNKSTPAPPVGSMNSESVECAKAGVKCISECPSPSASVTMRYSINELRSMNQFPAPV